MDERAQKPSAKPAARRPLPQVRRSSAGYEITYPKRPAAASVISALFGALRDAWKGGGEAVGDAYAAGARVLIDRKEALEDIAAERRHRAREAALPAPAADHKTGS